MASINKVILIGNLGSDPEVRYLPSGAAVGNFNIATTEKWTGKDGKPGGEKTEWHRIVVFGKQAENCKQYLSKGRQVYIEGRLQFLGGPGGGAGRDRAPAPVAGQEAPAPSGEEPSILGGEDDIPF